MTSPSSSFSLIVLLPAASPNNAFSGCSSQRKTTRNVLFQSRHYENSDGFSGLAPFEGHTASLMDFVKLHRGAFPFLHSSHTQRFTIQRIHFAQRNLKQDLHNFHVHAGLDNARCTKNDTCNWQVGSIIASSVTTVVTARVDDPFAD